MRHTEQYGDRPPPKGCPFFFRVDGALPPKVPDVPAFCSVFVSTLLACVLFVSPASAVSHRFRVSNNTSRRHAASAVAALLIQSDTNTVATRRCGMPRTRVRSLLLPLLQ